MNRRTQPTQPTQPTRTRRARTNAAAFLTTLALASLLSIDEGSAAKKSSKPSKVTVANGKACTTPGASATAAGKTYSCVRLKSKALQWWSPGTIQNPIKLGRAARVSGAASGAWDITVVRRIDDDTARILAIEANNRVSTPGNTLTSVELRAKSLGPDPETSIRATSFVLATAVRERVERWELGQSAPEDCWRDERVANGAEKICQFPYEITPGTELVAARLVVRASFGLDAPLYFDTAVDQPPLR
jgi:hypothetical protein